MKLKHKINLAVSLLLTITVLCLGLIFFTVWISSLKLQLGREALDLSLTLSHSEVIKDYIILDNGYIKIQNYVERLRLNTRINYIHVINNDGIIYSNPLAGRIGQLYDNRKALKALDEGRGYILNTGLFARSTEACSIVYHEGIKGGIVVVGLLNGRLYQEVNNNIVKFLILLAVSLIGGNLIAYLLSDNIKKTIYGLEPAEIAYLLSQKDIVLDNLNEGIVSFDSKGSVELINRAAELLLDIDKNNIPESDYRQYFSEGFNKTIETGESSGPYEVITERGKALFINFYPRKDSTGRFPGVIAGIEDRTEAKRKAEELTGMKQITFSLRAQNHEFMNKLHTISGLIQMEEYDEAVKYINITAADRAEILYTLGHRIKELSLAGLLLSKYNKAEEARILMRIDENSSICENPSTIASDDLCSLVGNLVENSIDELAGAREGEIFVGIYELESGLSIIIEDNGRGIPEDVKQCMFCKGVSSKGPDRGYGLYIIKNIVDRLNGSIEVDSRQGCVFNIFIPYREGK